MRTTTIKDVKYTYADDIGFAFMPCVITAQGETMTGWKMAVKITLGDKSYSCTVDGFGTKFVLDYREYVQALFDGIDFGNLHDNIWQTDNSNLGARATGSGAMQNGTLVTSYASFNFTTFYVWGAMRANETWGGIKHLTYFRNFPFSFGVYAKAATSILVGWNNAPNKAVNIDGEGMYEVMANMLPKTAKYSIIYNYDGQVQQATFDNKFDLTFYLKGGTQTRLLRIDYDDTETGLYLRWVDRHGFYRYWLFTMGDEARDVSTDGEFVRNNLYEYDSTYGYYGANGRRQGYQREDTIPICAPSVDRDTFDMLQDLSTSPVVDMYLGNNQWQGVTIKAGSYTKTTACLQDFIANVVLNDTYIQRL